MEWSGVEVEWAGQCGAEMFLEFGRNYTDTDVLQLYPIYHPTKHSAIMWAIIAVYEKYLFK